MAQVSAGGMHSLLLLEGGQVMTLGCGDCGRLGHGDEEHQHTPRLVKALRGKKVLQMSAGGEHSLVVLEGGGVVSFGSGENSRLGHGDEEHQHTPKPIEALRGKKVLQASAGGDHSLVLLEEGGVVSFGYGDDGQLGHGDEEDQRLPKLIEAAAAGMCVVEAAAGIYSSVLLQRSGEVRHLGGIAGAGQ